MLHYILQTIAFQLVFLIIYDVVLKKETFFNYNRAYLLIAAISSIILPFIKISSFKSIVSDQLVIRLPEVIIGNAVPQVTDPIAIQAGIVSESSNVWTWELFLIIGACVAALILAIKMIKLFTLLVKNPKRWEGNLLIVKLLKSNAAFSFFHYVFLGDQIKSEEQASILKHESIHVPKTNNRIARIYCR
ncbi:hypothetical protein [Ichthyenterobacterium magnum]|uniref:BlaR1 peptidase M56 n=1 Tax=Ichthyenterobacterium magnum TaxID=1230530 RepID=A0A420DW66_9FLAO|nr:hypothetical protein [Ichthyenterobacterium magnum]RKE98470.1 hypothetical protein BXY80_0558 [Ichthyenterobacterium magnum]